MPERLQKILSKAGFGSRRACEELIKSKKVNVNGQVAILGTKAELGVDNITLNGVSIGNRELPKKYFVFNKPRGILSEIYPRHHEKTVRDFISCEDYLFIVGRLDKESEGLILLTNDGNLANRLTHPRYEHEKEYRVLISPEPTDQQLISWRNGVNLPDGHRTLPARVNVTEKESKGTWLSVIMREGRKRQIREVGLKLGLVVKRIIRIRIGNITLGDLKPGYWRRMNDEEVRLMEN